MTDKRRPRSRSLASDRSGQASTIGTALLLVITLVGTGLIVTLGGSAIDGTQQSADVSRAEHSMTMLDSRAAVVALEETESQSTRFGQPESGSYRVDEDAGRMTVVHLNHTGTGDDETIYTGELGAVVYENDETTVAYQGGGVWRGDGNASRLVSPPEFHYRQSTLTLPIIQVVGSDSSTGGSALLTSDGGRPVYPNSSAEYDATTEPYANPIDNGTVAVSVQGEYYQGWAQYFRTRTDGNVTVDHANRTVTVELVAIDLVGDFEFPPENEPIRIRNMQNDHALNQFEVTLSEGSQFNNMYFSFYLDEGSQEFEVVVHVPSNPQCSGGALEDGHTLVMDVYYYDDSTPEGHHAWTNDTIPAEEGPVRLQCAGGPGNNRELYIDFTSGQELAYGNFTTSNNVASDRWYHDWDNTTESPVDLDQHGHTEYPPDDDFVGGEKASLDLLMNHYLALFAPDADLRYNQGTGNAQGNPGNPMDYQASGGAIEYDATGNTKFITFLHISENRVRVEFE
jgi:hypothetical protein